MKTFRIKSYLYEKKKTIKIVYIAKNEYISDIKKLNVKKLPKYNFTTMLLNLSNHPSALWTAEQLAAAGSKVTDLPFPQVDPDGDEAYIDRLTDEYLHKILAMNNIDAVHIMGEMNFMFTLICKLKAHGIKCVASTTQRETEEENGVKISKFKFVRFREY